jgi:hypothetical protein
MLHDIDLVRQDDGVSEQPGDVLSSDDVSDAGGVATPEDGNTYNLGMPHRLAVSSEARFDVRDWEPVAPPNSLRAVLPEIILRSSSPLPYYSKRLADALALPVEDLLKKWAPTFARMAKDLERMLPLNWHGTTKPGWGVIESILLDEGITLAWVPRKKMLQALFDAKDGTARRVILDKHWMALSADCEQVLGEISHRQLASHVSFAKKAVDALNAGHEEAAQALSVNLLDSILGQHFDETTCGKLTGRKRVDRLDVKEYEFEVAMVLAPVWRAHEKFRLRKDLIPDTFTRHASVHAVSRRQYSRVNAVVALMLVASTLKFLDEHSED